MISQDNGLIDKLEQFKESGFIILEDVVPQETIEQAAALIADLMEKKRARFGIRPIEKGHERMTKNDGVKIDFQPEGANHDLNRWNMHLSSDSGFLNDELLANPSVLEILEPLFGKDMALFIAASDTPYPNSGIQNAHQDFSRFGVTVNIPLVDFCEDNAPLEIWPETHRSFDGSMKHPFSYGKVNHSEADLQKILNSVPSRRVLVKKGSIIIRDQRLVHRGTNNATENPRFCISLWYKNPNKYDLRSITIPAPSRDIANKAAKKARHLREDARAGIVNKKLLNWANLYGRVIEELSCSDRDDKRPIPGSLWNNMSPRLKHLLRYGCIKEYDGTLVLVEGVLRSTWGTLQLMVVDNIFSLVGRILALKK